MKHIFELRSSNICFIYLHSFTYLLIYHLIPIPLSAPSLKDSRELRGLLVSPFFALSLSVIVFIFVVGCSIYHLLSLPGFVQYINVPESLDGKTPYN